MATVELRKGPIILGTGTSDGTDALTAYTPRATANPIWANYLGPAVSTDNPSRRRKRNVSVFVTDGASAGTTVWTSVLWYDPTANTNDGEVKFTDPIPL